MRKRIQYISALFATAIFATGCTSTNTIDDSKEYLLSNYGYEASQIIKKNRASENDVLKVLVAAAEKSERPNSIADFILGGTATQISSEKFITWLNAQDITNVASTSSQTYVNSVKSTDNVDTHSLATINSGTIVTLQQAPATEELFMEIEETAIAGWVELDNGHGATLQIPEITNQSTSLKLPIQDKPSFFDVGGKVYMVAF